MKAKYVSITVLVINILFIVGNKSYAHAPTNKSPVAILKVKPGYVADEDTAYVIVNRVVTLDGSASYDPDGSVVLYQWDFDGDSIYDYYETAAYYPDGAFDGVATYVYDTLTPPPYKAVLRVKDNRGAYSSTTSSSATCKVDVSPDEDVDDLADNWEEHYWASHETYNGIDDPDADGRSNLIEYIYGTDPTSNTSYPTGDIKIAVPNEASSIGYAIDTCLDLQGVNIIISPGTYHVNIDFNGKAITIRSTDPDDPEVIAATIITGTGSGAVVTFNSSEDANSILRGLTITGGERGISCEGTSPTISRCVIIENKSGI